VKATRNASPLSLVEVIDATLTVSQVSGTVVALPVVLVA
jgi:hypothetical protein